jgi:hypothetical protein
MRQTRIPVGARQCRAPTPDDVMLYRIRTYAQVTENRTTEDTARSLSGGFRRSFAKRAVGKTRSKRSHAAGFTLRYPLAQPAAAKSSVGGFPAVGNFSRQASELFKTESTEK